MSEWNKHYHWKTKGCTPWAKNHITEATVGKSVAVGKQGSVRIDKLSSFEGDVELGNRKGKLITIYDCSITYAWSGSADDGTTAEGTITFPEVCHEVEDNDEDYRFETEMSTATSVATQILYQVVRNQLAPSLRPVFRSFRQELIDAHAKDLGHQDSPLASGTSTPAAVSSTSANATTTTTSKAVSNSSSAKAAAAVSTSSSDVRVSSQLAASIQDLWDLLTNSAKIPMWTRAPAQFEAQPEAQFSLFGGNVTGRVVSVDAPRQIIQKWRIPQFPQGHYATLAMNLTEGDDSTKLELVLSGSPMGDEETMEKSLDNYYIRGLKQMGLGTIL